MQPYAKVQIVEVADEKAPDSLSEAEEVLVREREGERILQHIRPDAHVIALAIDGRAQDSLQFAAELQQLATYAAAARSYS